MNCPNCGATVTPACLAHRACTFCGAAIQPAQAIEPAQGPSLQHGVAEILQALGQGQAGNVQTFVSSSITVNGRTYRSVDELPPHLRATFEQGLQMAQQAVGMGSNVTIQKVTTQESFEVPVQSGAVIAPWPALPPQVSVQFKGELDPTGRKGRVGLVVALAVVALLIAAAVAFTFAR